MAGYLRETDFVMVEEGFSTRDLLEELTLGASQATTEEVTAFFMADLGAVVRKHFCFLKCLPRVRSFYAVKCNSSLGVLKVLAELGLGFSCANKAEMELVQHIGVPASKIIYANPCKQIAHIKYAAKHGVQLLSFDNEMELAKVVKSHPRARMVLCVATEDSHSLSRLSLKFGASLKSCRHLLENAKRDHVEVVGVSFHIGSGCPDPQAYAQSIADARLVFEMGAELGHRMHILDLGGGFPGVEGAKVRFEERQGPGKQILAEVSNRLSCCPNPGLLILNPRPPSPLQGSPARAAAACRTGRGRRGHVQASVLWLGDHGHLVHGPRLHPGEHHVSGPRSPPENPSGAPEMPLGEVGKVASRGTLWPGLWCSLCHPPRSTCSVSAL
ncbi:hypothetical protein FD754_004578 [Muntiacus muntjak]|uniref:Orn/DAP/Arg decarboxylase 2 N-terminal domain-containing protein n=1 Tax=Muntiacus muntjak TaxID=9888 RepID=A0A5N3WFA3_MUNMU|nr:hypothetical protein FD754_004578 [Muntiacus muntjak]